MATFYQILTTYPFSSGTFFTFYIPSCLLSHDQFSVDFLLTTYLLPRLIHIVIEWSLGDNHNKHFESMIENDCSYHLYDFTNFVCTIRFLWKPIESLEILSYHNIFLTWTKHYYCLIHFKTYRVYLKDDILTKSKISTEFESTLFVMVYFCKMSVCLKFAVHQLVLWSWLQRFSS